MFYVVQAARALGIHHFAFVRASLLGVDLREAFTRYLAWGESTTDLRYIQNRRETLLKQIIEAGRHFDATLAPRAKVGHLLDLLRSDASLKPAVVLPSLEDWLDAEGMDPDAWSQAELLTCQRARWTSGAPSRKPSGSMCCSASTACRTDRSDCGSNAFWPCW